MPYERFRDLVRRYPRSELLYALAAASARLEQGRREGQTGHSGGVVQPFAVAGIARAALADGVDYRGARVDDEAIGRLCSSFISIADPAVTDEGLAEGGLSRLMARIAHEQFARQYSPMENISRTVLLLEDHHVGVRNAPTPADWSTPLGLDLEQYMNVGPPHTWPRAGTVARSPSPC